METGHKGRNPFPCIKFLFATVKNSFISSILLLLVIPCESCNKWTSWVGHRAWFAPGRETPGPHQLAPPRRTLPLSRSLLAAASGCGLLRVAWGCGWSLLVSAHWCVAGNKPCGLINKLREPIRGLERVHELPKKWDSVCVCVCVYVCVCVCVSGCTTYDLSFLGCNFVIFDATAILSRTRFDVVSVKHLEQNQPSILVDSMSRIHFEYLKVL